MLAVTSQRFAGVILSLRTASSGGSEKRQATRIDLQSPVRFGVLTGPKVVGCFIALSRDISATGIGLLQSIKFGPNEMFLLSLPLGKHHRVLVCQAMFCRPLADGIYCVGAQFESVADEAQTHDFRAVAAAAVGAAA